MAAYVQEAQLMTRRGVVLIAIIALHVFIAWAIATGLARRAIEVLAPPIQTQIVQEVKPKDLPPPPPPPKFERPPVEVPPPEVSINVPVETNTTAITAVTTHHTEAPPRPAAPVRRTPGGPGTNFPNTEDYYPASSRRLEEQGTTVVHVCVGANGRLMAISVPAVCSVPPTPTSPCASPVPTDGRSPPMPPRPSCGRGQGRTTRRGRGQRRARRGRAPRRSAPAGPGRSHGPGGGCPAAAGPRALGREIAAQLVISPKTARNHIEHIYAKTGATSRVTASLFAMQQGLLPEN